MRYRRLMLAHFRSIFRAIQFVCVHIHIQLFGVSLARWLSWSRILKDAMIHLVPLIFILSYCSVGIKYITIWQWRCESNDLSRECNDSEYAKDLKPQNSESQNVSFCTILSVSCVVAAHMAFGHVASSCQRKTNYTNWHIFSTGQHYL